MFNKRCFGFTLAEVLIALTIIGIIAALTVPTLVQRYEEKKAVAQLSKVYSTLSQAWFMMQTEYGRIDQWDLAQTNTGRVDEQTGERILDNSSRSLVSARIRKYLKVSKVCKVGEICYPYASESINGTEKGQPQPTSVADVQFWLNDGTFISMGYYSGDHIDFYVTLPGNKSILGRTSFYFVGTAQGMAPENIFELCDPRITSQAGRGCTAWVLEFKNMDYLHCREELSWEGKHSCNR